MTNLLAVTARIQNSISLGEDHFREFKSAYDQEPGKERPRRPRDVCVDIARTLVAFANADGGDLLVGVEDDGEITGIPHVGSDLHVIQNAPKTHIMDGDRLDLQHQSIITLQGKRVLLFSVLKSAERIFQTTDGRAVKRRGLQSDPIDTQTLLFERMEQRSRTHDSEFVDDATMSDLNIELVADIATRYIQGLTPELYLQQIGLAQYAPGGLRLRRAALLLFAQDIARWHPRCQIRILRVAGESIKEGADYNVTQTDIVEGNVLQLLTEGWESLRPYLVRSAGLGIDARFRQRYIYPEHACREALTNALTHRDYVSANSVDLYVFDDKMEIRSPGPLLSTISTDQLLALEGAHESRNALVARVLREASWVQELGEGMRRIFRLMEENSLQMPRLDNTESSFSVLLYHRSVFAPQQQTWLKLFEQFNLSQLQQRIVVAGMGDHLLSPDDLYKAMNTRNRDTYDREVTYLRRNGLLLEMVSQVAAGARAKQHGVEKGTIGRYKVANPLVIPPSARVRLGGMPRSINESALREALSGFGPIAHVHLVKGHGRGDASAVVTFSSPASADAAVDQETVLVSGKACKVAYPVAFAGAE